jgi:hypothetical protein
MYFIVPYSLGTLPTTIRPAFKKLAISKRSSLFYYYTKEGFSIDTQVTVILRILPFENTIDRNDQY